MGLAQTIKKTLVGASANNIAATQAPSNGVPLLLTGTTAAQGPTVCSFVGTISTTTLTVTSISFGFLAIGQTIAGASVTAGSIISAFGTGSGGTGTYTISQSSTVAVAESMYSGVTIAQLDTARRILVTPGGDTGARTMLIVGTTARGTPISETVTLTSGSSTAVATLQDFETVISATPIGAAWSANVTIGTNTTGSTSWHFVNAYVTPMEFGVTAILQTGSATFSAEWTNDNPNTVGLNAGVIPNAFPFPNINAATATSTDSLNMPFLAWRITITSGTGTVSATGIPAGVMQ